MDIDLPVPQRRGDSREAVSIPAAVFADGFPQPVELECTNLSNSGMYLQGNPSLVLGEEVLLVFIPPGTWHRIYVDAVVVRTTSDDGRGLGLHFSRMPRHDNDVLRSALDHKRERTRAWDLAVADLEFDIESN